MKSRLATPTGQETLSCGPSLRMASVLRGNGRCCDRNADFFLLGEGLKEVREEGSQAFSPQLECYNLATSPAFPTTNGSRGCGAEAEALNLVK